MAGITIDLSRAKKAAEMFFKVEALADQGLRNEALELLERAKKYYSKLSPLEQAHCNSAIEKHRGLV
mgnify:CR=1 FL=1